MPERHRPRARHSAPQFVIVMKIDRSSSLSLVIPAPQFVTPAKAGVQTGGGREPANQRPAAYRQSRSHGLPLPGKARRRNREANRFYPEGVNMLSLRCVTNRMCVDDEDSG